MSTSYPLREQGTFLVVESTGWDCRLSVAADGKRLAGHAGAVLLRKVADRVGLTRGLAGVLPSSTAAGWRERAGVLAQLAVAIVLGAANLSEAEQLQLHQLPLFGSVASDSTTRRTLAALDETNLIKIAKARARVRRHVWGLLRLRPGGFPWLFADHGTLPLAQARCRLACLQGTHGPRPWNHHLTPSRVSALTHSPGMPSPYRST